MSKKATVELEKIASELTLASNGIEQYLNTVTGEFAILFDEDTEMENEEELLEDIKNSGNYVCLPSSYDLHEYSVMSDFAETVSNPYKQNKLFYALNGKKPFRHFKDTLIYNNLEKDYFAFRNQRYIEIARHWCNDNEIPFVEKK